LVETLPHPMTATLIFFAPAPRAPAAAAAAAAAPVTTVRLRNDRRPVVRRM